MLLRAIDEKRMDGDVGDLPRRVAEEVSRWLMEHGLVVTGGVQATEQKEGQERQDEPEVPRNPVTSFLQRWDDD
ncbi:hypothetical protein [Alicyclobacillus macrosporangiidus]|uniref:hypothetical protein n=1 Tax=Alicyclobacillus macrosporangiidus TaxID=392015 RepID=UPI00068CF71C|nr:hypothetical protein [Alicyclobacillus macrosporangiidus]